MKPVLTTAEMRRLDAESDRPVDALMDAAGYAVAREAIGMGIGYGSRVHVLCGKGNNGGDGYVAARYLRRRGADVHVHFAGLPDSESPAGRAADKAASEGVRFTPISNVAEGDLVIDAVVGTGFRGELSSEVAAWTEDSPRVLAVDVPSGLDGTTGEADGSVFRAERTVTFHALKVGHVLGSGPDLCGEVVVVDIGLDGGDAAFELIEPTDLSIPRRSRRDHKWQAGAVVTVGGMPGLTGAALLAARSALRAGAGVSSVLTTAATAALYEAMAPEVLTIQASETASWYDHASEVLALTPRYDVLVVGPGLEPPPPDFVELLLQGFDGPMVVDAGALGASHLSSILPMRTAPTVLTPHAGEFARITGTEPSNESAMELAASTGAVVLLKGSPTFVASSALHVIDVGGSELATIGSGDVLAGIIASLLASGMEAARAAWTAAYLHGLVGRRAAINGPPTVNDLLENIGPTIGDVGRASGTQRWSAD